MQKIQGNQIDKGEYYRILANELCKYAKQGMQCFGVTSYIDQQGKTDIILNIGKLLNKMGYKILIIDGNLNQPSLSRRIKCRKAEGVVEAIEAVKSDRESDEIRRLCLSFAQPISVDKVDFYCRGGYLGKNYKEYIEVEHIQSLLSILKEQYQIILIESTSLNYLSFAQGFLEAADGYFLVIKAGTIAHSQSSELKDKIARIKSKNFGVVLYEEKRRLWIKNKGKRQKWRRK